MTRKPAAERRAWCGTLLRELDHGTAWTDLVIYVTCEKCVASWRRRLRNR